MLSNTKCMQTKNCNPILHICAKDVWQKQINLFVIQSQNTQFSLYFVIQVVIQNERLHKLITLYQICLTCQQQKKIRFHLGMQSPG